MGRTKLLYIQVADYLREKILSGEMKGGDRLPTEANLIEKFEVSSITVKRALDELKKEGLIYRLRGSGSYVSYDIGEEKSDKDIYQKVVSVVLPFPHACGGALDIISGVSDIMRKHGYVVEAHCAERSAEQATQLLDSLYRQQVGGIIYYPFLDYANIDVMQFLCLENFPVVLLDKYYENFPISCVTSNGRKGMYEATRYLLELKHRRIAFVTDVKVKDAITIRERYYGYTQAMHEYGIAREGMCIKYVHNANDAEAMKLLDEIKSEGITAVCAVNDYLAAYIINFLRAHNVKIPEQISVIGFDDVELNKFWGIPLTTVRQDMYKMGCEAGKIMLDTIKQKKNLGIRSILPTKLIVRDSCSGL